jgi:toxin FitB
MILIDSFGWIEYFTDGPLADKYEKYFKDLSGIFTPTIIIYEVYKKIKQEKGEDNALVAVGQLLNTILIPLDLELSLSAADYSLKYALPMADAIIYAAAQAKGCKMVTSDSHFTKLDGIIFIK